MKIAITGATGFIGQHVVAELERHSISPTLICLPCSEIPKQLEKYARTLFDLRNLSSDAFNLIGKPDIVIHLAWGGLPNYKSLHHFEEELQSQYRFLKGLIESGLKNLLVTGTCFEYGMQSGLLSEDLDTRPTNPYGFAKDMLRRQLEYLKQIKSFNLTWARLFYLYGEGQSQNSIFTQLKNAINQGEKTFNMSGGEQLRDYMPVTEIAKYVVSLAILKQDIGIVNVCSGKPVSVRKLVEDWLTNNNWNIKLNLGYYPYPDYEPMAFWGSNNKCVRHLNEK